MAIGEAARVVILGAAGRDFDNFNVDKPVVRARYEFADAGDPTLGALADRFLARDGGRRPG